MIFPKLLICLLSSCQQLRQRICQLRRFLQLSEKLFCADSLPLRRFDLPQIRIGVKCRIKFLRIDLSILIKNVRIHLRNHLNLSMTRIALSGF